MKTSLGSILKTSVPIVFDLAAQIIMWSVEVTLVSRIAPRVMDKYYPRLNVTGVDALTAVGNVVQIVIVTCTVLLIFVFGATIIINKLIGSGDRDRADHFLGQSLFTTLFAAVGVGLVWYFLSPVIFRVFLGAPEGVTAIGIDYFRVIAFFSPFIILNFVAIGIVRGAGDTHLSMVTSLLVNSIHLVLAVLLIYGVWFFPPMGVKGSALAAGIGHTVGCCFTFSVILTGKSVLTFRWSDFTGINTESIVRVIKTGLPIALEQLVWTIGILIVISFSNRFGAVAAAAHIIVLNYQRIFSMIYQAFGIGALSLVGQRFGAKHFEHARHTTVMFFWLVGGFVLVLSVAVFFKGRYLTLLFSSDEAVASICIEVFKVAAFIQLPKALSYIYSFSLRGIGENRYPMYLAIAGVLIFEVILGYNLAFTLGMSIVGLWLAQCFDEVFKVSLAARRFYRKIHYLKANPVK